MSWLRACTLCFLIAGCAGRVDYQPPASVNTASNFVVISKPFDDVWSSAVPEVGRSFFVINNIEKDSGIINVSYTGDPEEYVDCGHIQSFVKNTRGERTYEFPAAKAHMQYEIMEDGGLYFVDRKMQLEGRVNLIFEKLSPNQTQVTANTRYVVERNAYVKAAAGPSSSSDSISFNTGGSGTFAPPRPGVTGTHCVSTGRLEEAILRNVR